MFGRGRDVERRRVDAEAEVARKQGFGGKSMIAPLRRVLVQAPAPPASEDDWRAFGYNHPVDHGQAVEEHAALCDILRGEGIEVVVQAADAPGNLDGIFVYDTAILTDDGAIVTRPGKALRREELPATIASFEELDIPMLGSIADPGTIEGGDTMWLDENTLVAGRSYRSNAIGIEQLQIYGQPFDVDVLAVSIPHWHGADECLHLLSLISPVDVRKAVVHLPLLSVDFVQLLRELDWTLIDIPEEEFATQGTNALALAPGRVLLLKENTGTRQRLEDAGVEVLVYTGDEISHNRQGGPTCLTRPLLRDISALQE
jgi:N-dimethylarginine dimethylaminohydrolase